MKNIKKLLLPIATVAASSAIVAPLITSCGATSSYVDVTHPYTPTITKHEKNTLTATEANEDYVNAIKKNPNIMAEDFKYSGSQMNEFLQELVKTSKEHTTNSDLNPTFDDYSVKSFRAGLGNVGFDEYGRVSYDCGLGATGYATISIPEQDESGEVVTKHPIDIDLDLDISSSIVNFPGLDVKHTNTLFTDNCTYVVPVWPNDLSQTDWSFFIGVHGSIKVTMDGTTILNLPNISIDKTFNADNYLLLQIDLSEIDTQSNASSSGIQSVLAMAKDIYLQDVLGFAASYVSYYMSDVTVQQHFQLLEPARIWADNSVSTGYRGTVSFQMDEARTNFDDISMMARVRTSTSSIKNSSSKTTSVQHIYPIDYSPTYTDAEFTFRPYIDSKGKQHDDICSVDFQFDPTQMSSLQEGELEFNIYCSQPRGLSYLWSEKHNDRFYIDWPMSTEIPYTVEIPAIQYITYNFQVTATKQIPVGSSFAIYDANTSAQLISVEEILADYQEFNNYIVYNNTIYTTKAIPTGTIMNFVVTFIGDSKTTGTTLTAVLTPAE